MIGVSPELSHLPRTEPWLGPTASSNEISNIKEHVLNGCIIDSFHVPRGPPIFCHCVDTHTLRAKISAMTNFLVIIFLVCGEVMFDGCSSLLYISVWSISRKMTISE